MKWTSELSKARFVRFGPDMNVRISYVWRDDTIESGGPFDPRSLTGETRDGKNRFPKREIPSRLTLHCGQSMCALVGKEGDPTFDD